MNYDDLYPHNKQSVDAVRKYFAEGNRKAAIVHATGTGKSYVIAAVADDYKSVLIVAPNNFVLDETRKVCHDGCEFRTYASVMYDQGYDGKYDLIVLDEFHRGGAEKWSVGVKKLIEANPQALLLGTSATHIRYLDNQRNMADELFDGNIVSYLPLKEAIDNGILPNPTYVSSIYTMDDMVKSYRKRIKESKKKGIDKESLCRRLAGIAHNWENAGGVPSIMRKYLNHDMQRIIVFCSKVKRASEARKILGTWFAAAGFTHIRYYNIDYTEKYLRREMDDFQADMGDYDLKVAISVNMLNEGVHIPHVDGVIMLRTTISRIIIEQQVGRCLTSNNNGITPVVLDLVNNMDCIRYDEPMYTDFKTKGSDEDVKDKQRNGFPFKVIDECRDIRVLIGQLDEELEYMPKGYWTYDRCKEEALKYKTRGAWSKGHSVSYSCARKNGWYEECCAHMEVLHGSHTKEECAASAMKYSSRREWEKNEPKFYSYAKAHGWYEECCAHMEVLWVRYTKEEVQADALKYDTKKEWIEKSPLMYKRAQTLACIREVTQHMSDVKNIWTKESVYEIAMRYSDYKLWLKNEPRCYEAALAKGWLDEVSSHMTNKKKIWTKEEVQAEALKFKRIKEWKSKSRKSYDAAVSHKWLEEVSKHMSRGHEPIWTDDKIIEVIKLCSTREEFKNKYPRAYGAARHRDYEGFMKYLPLTRTRWDKELVIKDARKYTTRSEWKRCSRTAYCIACKNGWREECCAHMTPKSKKTNK